MSKFLNGHLATVAMVIIYVLLGVFVFGFGLGTIWYTLINWALWIARGVIANITSSIIEHKTGNELSKKDEQNVHYAVNLVLIALTIVLPLVFWLIVMFFGYIGTMCGAIASTLADDLTNTNGIGMLIFAIAEILVTVAAIIANCYFAGKKQWVGIAAATVVQTIISCIYYWGIAYGNILDIILNVLLLVVLSAIVLVVIKLISKMKP